MKSLRFLWLGLLLAVLVAACAKSGDNDNAKNQGLYGGGSGGWTHLQQQ